MDESLSLEIPALSSAEVGPRTLAGAPLVIRAGAAEWPARSEWSAEYLGRQAGGIEIPVWVFTGEPVPSRRAMTRLSDYLAWILASEEEDVAEPTVQYYAGRVHFSWLPERLRRDVLDPPFLGRPPTEANVWIGRRGTSSGLHCDETIGLLAQVLGRKEATLVPPEQWPLLYAYPTARGPNSRVDVLAPDYERFPLARRIRARRAVLEPGDMLYIPAGWWHNLRTVGGWSISVNFWWSIPLWRHLAVSNLRGMWLARARGVLLQRARRATGRIAGRSAAPRRPPAERGNGRGRVDDPPLR